MKCLYKLLFISVWFALSVNIHAQNSGFNSEQVLVEGSNVLDFVIYDIDNDGDNDIVYSTGVLIYYSKNNGNGNFDEPVTLWNVQNGGKTKTKIALADMDGDGDVDVIAASDNFSEIMWYENQGDFFFEEINNFIQKNDFSFVYDLIVADVDGDNDIDVVLASINKLSWYKNNGDGTFEDQSGGEEEFNNQIVITENVGNNLDIELADMDFDGDLDLSLADPIIDKIAYYPNDGNGGFNTEIVLYSETNDPTVVLPVDMDGDQVRDIIFTVPQTGEIRWYQNQGTGTFNGPIVVTDSASFVRQFAVGALNDDIFNDIVFFSSGKISWIENNLSGYNEYKIADSGTIRQFELADIDGDGDLDILARSSSKLVWYENDLENFVLNTPPVANNDTFDMFDGTTLTVEAPGVLANDSDPQNDTLFLNGVVGEAANGTFTFNGTDGGFYYTPNTNFSGLDSIKYELSDGLEIDQAMIYINVIALPSPPYEFDEQINAFGSFVEFILGPVQTLPAFTLNNANGANALYEIVSDSQDGDDKALKIDFGTFNNRVSPDDEWHVEVAAEALRVQNGDQYEASVWLKADTDTRLAAFYFGLPAAGNWMRYGETHVTLSKEWVNYKVYHTATAKDEEIGIRFGTLLNFAPNDSSVITFDNLSITKVMPTSNEDELTTVRTLTLYQNYPNPFNPSTLIGFSLPSTSAVTIEVFDLAGRKVATILNNKIHTSGTYSYQFDASNLSSGVYFYQLSTQDGFNSIKKMTLIK